MTLRAVVPGFGEAQFQNMALAAKQDCPLPQALASVPETTLKATLDAADGLQTPKP